MAKTDQTVSPQIIWAIVGTGILAFTGILTETSMNVTFPDLMKQFNISLSVVQWLTTAYLLMVSLVMTTSAFLKAKFNPRQIFIIAIVAFLIGDIVAIMSHSFALLLVGRVIQGIGTGVITPLVFNIILENVPMAHIGKYIGLWYDDFIVGTSLWTDFWWCRGLLLRLARNFLIGVTSCVCLAGYFN